MFETPNVLESESEGVAGDLTQSYSALPRSSAEISKPSTAQSKLGVGVG